MWIQQINLGNDVCVEWQRHVWTMVRECRIQYLNVN